MENSWKIIFEKKVVTLFMFNELSQTATLTTRIVMEPNVNTKMIIFWKTVTQIVCSVYSPFPLKYGCFGVLPYFITSIFIISFKMFDVSRLLCRCLLFEEIWVNETTKTQIIELNFSKKYYTLWTLLGEGDWGENFHHPTFPGRSAQVRRKNVQKFINCIQWVGSINLFNFRLWELGKTYNNAHYDQERSPN